MFGLKKKSIEEKIIELAKKYSFDVYPKKSEDHSFPYYFPQKKTLKIFGS